MDNKYSRRASIISGGYFLKNLIDEMSTYANQIKNSKNTTFIYPKFSIYSAHDETLFGILSLLRVSNPSSHPVFASNMIFELWKKDNGCDDYNVRIISNGKSINSIEDSFNSTNSDIDSSSFSAYKKKINSLTKIGITEECFGKFNI
ncbi:2-phosphoxylose phosphatase 1 [Smittium culicis]|uniref:2-phosphoxylose phosphatase 1 n=1 Tax=Smittium culicis TaxID=133412 RepID=A0A1R1XCH3_9FUNG|nr:2-phosphoxylose phosphatase 1 [Smittium culicis]